MARFIDILRRAIDATTVICTLLALAIPLWFAVAAFGTKWEFWDWHTGLEMMTQVWGSGLLIVGLAVGVLAASLILTHFALARQAHGNWASAAILVLVAAAGLGWMMHIDRLQQAGPALLDITTDFADPPGFSTAFLSRRADGDASLVYAGKTASDGQELAGLQAQYYPEIRSLYLAEPADAVFTRALDLARDLGWRVGTASRQAGMFEAGAEGLWFGFRDDMVVRIRADEAGGSVVDVRSLARQPAHDLGRNAHRVQTFLEALAAGQV